MLMAVPDVIDVMDARMFFLRDEIPAIVESGPGDPGIAEQLHAAAFDNEACMIDEGDHPALPLVAPPRVSCRRSEEHTSELQSLMRLSYAVFCLNNKKITAEWDMTHVRPIH